MKKRLYDIHVVYELEDEDEHAEKMSDDERAKAESDCLETQIQCWDIPGDVKEIQVTAKTIQE